MRIGEFLVVEVAAFFRQQLVFDMDGASAGVLERPHHMHDVERFAIAGVAIDQTPEGRNARAICRMKKATSSTVMMPRSGRPIEAVIAAPERYSPSKPAALAPDARPGRYARPAV